MDINPLQPPNLPQHARRVFNRLGGFSAHVLGGRILGRLGVHGLGRLGVRCARSLLVRSRQAWYRQAQWAQARKNFLLNRWV